MKDFLVSSPLLEYLRNCRILWRIGKAWYSIMWACNLYLRLKYSTHRPFLHVSMEESAFKQFKLAAFKKHFISLEDIKTFLCWTWGKKKIYPNLFTIMFSQRIILYQTAQFCPWEVHDTRVPVPHIWVIGDLNSDLNSKS